MDTKWPPCGFRVAVCLSFFFPSVLEKPSQTAVAKGGCVCENTHLSPADGSFPWPYCPTSQTAFQGLAFSTASPAGYWHHITLLTRSFVWIKHPQHVFRCRSIPGIPLSTSVHPVHTSQWCICCYNAELLCAGIKYESAALKYRVGEMRQNCLEKVLKWPGLPLFCLPVYRRADLWWWLPSINKVCVFPLYDVEKWAFHYLSKHLNETLLCCHWIFSSIPPGVLGKFRCEAFTPKTSITPTC